MKNLRKIIIFFSILFIIGILTTIVIVNRSLNKTEIQKNTSKKHEDSSSVF